MRISQKHQFLYLSHGKTASTSIRSLLNSYCEDPFIDKQLGWHPDIKKISNYCSKSKINLDQLYKFSFVRNPWDRVLSSYFYYKKLEPFSQNGKRKSFFARTKSFDWWVRNMPISTNNQYPRMLDERGNLSMDFIGKTENLEKDLNFVLKKLSLNTVKIPKLNSTNHKHYSHYYDERSSDIVYEACKIDIETFNYKFGD
jgi:hypothetical protein